MLINSNSKIIFIVTLTFLLCGCTSMQKKYDEERLSELEKHIDKINNELFTEDDIKNLPAPVQKYFRYCGYIGKEKMINAEVIWSDSYIKMNPDQDWMRLETYQFNSITEPFRIALMKAKMFGIIPFEGRDIYQNGYGSMLGKILNLITVVNADDKEIAQSALITILAEALLVPSYALQEYISWEAVNAFKAKGKIQHKEIEATGEFFFNEKGELITFESNDRYYNKPEGGYEKNKFSVSIGSYQDNGGVKIPTKVSVVWHLDTIDFEYWKGTIAAIDYNVKE